MKTKLRIRIIWESTITRVIILITLVALLLLAIILPSVLTSRPKGSVLAFNRDATSGTREAFVEKILQEDKSVWSPSINVREVSNNDKMITSIQKEDYSLGYVSFGTVANFDEDGNPFIKDGNDNIAFATYDNIIPTKDNIKLGVSTEGESGYFPVRNFNSFFRVENNSSEAEILKYDFSSETPSSTIDINKLNSSGDREYLNTLEISYLFYNWILHSNKSIKVIEDGSEISVDTNEHYDFTKEMVETYANTFGLTRDFDYKIDIVGSTSATSIMKDLKNEFIFEMENIFGVTPVINLATNGSGDAFKTSVPGAVNSFIGLQSREASDDELLSWGWDLDESSKVYNSFAIDALLIVYNNSTINNKNVLLNVNSKTMNDLYSGNEYVFYEDVFTNFEEAIK